MRPNCMKCIYYYVTWDPARPRGCKYFGFKSIAIPAMVVYRSSGQDCEAYQKKN